MAQVPQSAANPGRLPLLAAIRLLRTDTYRAFRFPGASDDDSFLLWWVISGHREYPPAYSVTESEKQRLFTPLAGWPSRAGLGMTPLMYCLFSFRRDLAATFDLNSAPGFWDAMAWFHVHGVPELKLHEFVPEHIRMALNAAAVDSPAPDEPEPSWLMYFLWRLRPELQATYDWSTPEGRGGMVAWFLLRGVEQFRLAALVSDRWIGLLESGRISRAGAGGMSAARKLREFRAPAIPAVQPAAARPGGRQSFGVNLIGFAFGELGIGEDVRMAALACQAAGIPYSVLNINPGGNVRQADGLLRDETTEDIQELPYGTNVFCLTGFDTLRVYAEKGPAILEGRRNIGWWPWELPVWPAAWTGCFDVIDEVWAATRFTETMFRQHTRRPVTRVPLPVSVDRIRRQSRRDLGLPSGKFLFLFIFDCNSYLARKNPEAVIQAFRMAFKPADNGAGLVIKTMNTRDQDPHWQQIQALCRQDARILLMDRTMDREDVLGLIGACDAYVSLHRAEGFGRTLAEAMLLGKPVVGTDFSGNTDFLNPETGFPVRWQRQPVRVGEYPFVTESDGAWWADPLVPDAARQMQVARRRAGPEWSRSVAARAESMFSPERIGSHMRQLLMAHHDPGRG